jgi:hypothetical protein
MPRAIFIPMLVLIGAGIICRECPEGLNRVYLTPAPYGDARRIRYLLRVRQDLREETRGFSPLEQGEHVEAWDRGELQLRERLSGRRALARAARKREDSALEQALGLLLLKRTQAGAGITTVITELHELSIASPIAFAAELATILPGFSELADSVAPDNLASAVAGSLGLKDDNLPGANRTQLWRIWQGVRPWALRHEANE